MGRGVSGCAACWDPAVPKVTGCLVTATRTGVWGPRAASFRRNWAIDLASAEEFGIGLSQGRLTVWRSVARHAGRSPGVPVSRTILLPFQPEAMTPAQLAAVSFLACTSSPPT